MEVIEMNNNHQSLMIMGSC